MRQNTSLGRKYKDLSALCYERLAIHPHSYPFTNPNPQLNPSHLTLTSAQMEQFEFHIPQNRWVQIEPKISEHTLNHDPASSRRTLLQKHDAGSRTAGDFIHDYTEEIYFVEGTLTDTKLEKTFEKGFYATESLG
jgi:hypothetical protein